MDPIPPQPAYAIAVITYNPEPPALAALCRRLSDQGAYRCLIDNGSDNLDALVDLAAETDFVLLAQGENLGIAGAANRWVESLPESIAAFALFDQDSLPEIGYCDELWQRLQRAQDGGGFVAAIGGRVFDAPEGLPLKFLRLGRLRVHELDPSAADVAPDYLIISGTLFDRATFAASGGFDAALFVDNVDQEWCYRVRGCGATLIGTASTGIEHRIGDECLAVPGLRRGLKIHAPSRQRLISRSRAISYRRPSLPLRWKYHDALRFTAKTLLLLAFHPQRLLMAREIAGGIVEGLRRTPPPPSAGALALLGAARGHNGRAFTHRPNTPAPAARPDGQTLEQVTKSFHGTAQASPHTRAQDRALRIPAGTDAAALRGAGRTPRIDCPGALQPRRIDPGLPAKPAPAHGRDLRADHYRQRLGG